MVRRWPLLALLALLALGVLPLGVQSPSVCEDKLGAECSAFSTMGECQGRRREWMQKNCALSCGACRPARPAPAPDAPKAARSAKEDEDWSNYVVELNDAAMLARFHRSNKQSMVRDAGTLCVCVCARACESSSRAAQACRHQLTAIGMHDRFYSTRTGTPQRQHVMPVRPLPTRPLGTSAQTRLRWRLALRFATQPWTATPSTGTPAGISPREGAFYRQSGASPMATGPRDRRSA